MSRSSSRKSLTPESLVSVLIPHISEQTLLLPDLHQQLGLPPSALESDLSALREALLKTVEDCVNNRKREIDQWNERCESVEARCRRLENALGRRAASLAELKRVNVYPVRHDQLSAQEEKLKQLYNSKLEQLNTLTNRISTLSYTLGSSFFSDDIMNPTPAPGELDASPIKSDDENYDHHVDSLLRDVTPERFNRLEKELVRGKAEIGRRLVSLSEIFGQIALLYTDLGILLPQASDPIPSMKEFPYPKPFVSKVATKLDPFSVAPAPDPDRQRREYFPLFAAFVSKLQEAVDEGRDVGGVEGIDPTVILIEWFERLQADLEEEKSRREAHIQELFDQLETLWKRLGISDADIDDFVELNCGSSTENVQAYEMELERMLEMKRERMSVFIGNARAEIERLWDDLMLSEEEREAFAAFHDDVHTEDLLTVHEEEIVKLKEDRRSKAPMLVSIRKYYQICEEQKQLEASASDQSRLLGRGSRGDPGRLLREEKMRKRVMKEKPKLEQELLVAVPHWEAENGKPLLVNGIHFLGQLEEAVRTEEAKAESKKRPRTDSNAGRAKTPAPPPPVSRKVSSALSVTPSMRSISGSSHAGSAFSVSTSSTALSVHGPASKRQKLNNNLSHPIHSTTTSTVIAGRDRSGSTKSVPQRPASRAGSARSVGTSTTGKVPLSIGIPARAPSRAGMSSRAPSPSKLSTVTTLPVPSPRRAEPSSAKSPIFPVLMVKNGPAATVKSGLSALEKKEAVAEVVARGKRRSSFKPRPSSPGLGREYAEMWRGKNMLKDDVLSEDSEAEL